MDVEHVRGVVGLDVDEGRPRPPLPIARAEVDAQDAVVDLVGDRHGGMVRHPLVLVVGTEDPPLLHPPHSRRLRLTREGASWGHGSARSPVDG